MQARHWLLIVLVAAEVFFVIMTLVSLWLEPQIARFTHFFDLDRELSIPTWFASSQLLVVGLILWLCGSFPAPDGGPSRRSLITAGGCFVYFSMDETAGIHERITDLFHEYSYIPHFSGDHGVWVFLYSIAGLAVLWFFRTDLALAFRFYRNPSMVMLTGFALFVAGGVGVELLLYEVIRDDTPALLKVAQYTAEEFLELLGGTIMLYGAILFHECTAARTADPDAPNDCSAPGAPG